MLSSKNYRDESSGTKRGIATMIVHPSVCLSVHLSVTLMSLVYLAYRFVSRSPNIGDLRNSPKFRVKYIARNII